MARLTPPRERWLDGRRLHCVEWGPADAPPVLLVHGITGNARNWSAFAELVARAHRLIAVDLRGHGESAYAEGEAYEHLDYMADLLLACEQLGAPVPMVGHSIGGHVCLILAALRPELVASLVVVDVEAFPPREQPEKLRQLGRHPHPVFPDLAAVAGDIRERLPGAPDRIVTAKAENDTVSQSDGTRVYRFDRAVLRRVTAPDARPYLPRVRCPVLLVRGENSHVMRRQAAREMAARIPRAAVVEIAGAAHWPHLENAGDFTRAVLEFLVETKG